MHGGNGLKFCMLGDPDYLQHWSDYSHGLLIFLIFVLQYFDLVKLVKFVVSWHFPENAWTNGLKFCMLMYPDHLHNWLCFGHALLIFLIIMGDPLHSRALAHSCAPLFTQPCPHCSHSCAPGEQWARLCVFMLQGCVQAARLCRGSPVIMVPLWLSETGNMWGLQALSGERLGVNVEGEWRHISDPLRWVLSSLHYYWRIFSYIRWIVIQTCYWGSQW